MGGCGWEGGVGAYLNDILKRQTRRKVAAISICFELVVSSWRTVNNLLRCYCHVYLCVFVVGITQTHFEVFVTVIAIVTHVSQLIIALVNNSTLFL